jgi:predicted Zn finger-like uncharacterized protein
MEIVTCPECKAEYAVEHKRSPIRDSDYFDCEDCGHRLKTWHSTTYPTYKKVKSGEKSHAKRP